MTLREKKKKIDNVSQQAVSLCGVKAVGHKNYQNSMGCPSGSRYSKIKRKAGFNIDSCDVPLPHDCRLLRGCLFLHCPFRATHPTKQSKHTNVIKVHNNSKGPTCTAFATIIRTVLTCYFKHVPSDLVHNTCRNSNIKTAPLVSYQLGGYQ